MCTTDELLPRQWINSEITLNLPRNIYLESDRVDSISAYNQDHFQKKLIPEIKAVASRIYKDRNFKIDSNLVSKIFSFNYGGILGHFDRLNFINLVENGKNYSQQVKEEFGLEFDDAEMIGNYFKFVVLKYLFDGLYVEKSANEFLFGYEDKYIKIKVFFNFL